jgi:hypothetical protein
METSENTGKRRRILGLLVIIFICLVLLLLAALLVRGGVFGNTEQLVGDAPTATVDEASETGSEDSPQESTSQQGSLNTPTATMVVQASEATPTATSSSQTAVSTSTPVTIPSGAMTTATVTPTVEVMEPVVANLLRNGNFEWGLGEDGVGLQWTRFDNGGAKYVFSAESWPLAIHKGDYAQRITVYEAHQGDRYAGIYQRVNVIPRERYRLKLYGQVRSWAGDINASNYGYRMQYAIDWTGGTDWQAIPDDKWVELPWDEQLMNSADAKLLDFSTTIVPPGKRLTLFIRAWNKWPDPVEAQYTLDTLSLVGPASPEALVDGALPVSGDALRGPSFLADPRLWASLLFLLFLAAATLWRNRGRQTTR